MDLAADEEQRGREGGDVVMFLQNLPISGRGTED